MFCYSQPQKDVSLEKAKNEIEVHISKKDVVNNTKSGEYKIIENYVSTQATFSIALNLKKSDNIIDEKKEIFNWYDNNGKDVRDIYDHPCFGMLDDSRTPAYIHH
jgi:hypothetical protein